MTSFPQRPPTAAHMLAFAALRGRRDRHRALRPRVGGTFLPRCFCRLRRRPVGQEFSSIGEITPSSCFPCPVCPAFQIDFKRYGQRHNTGHFVAQPFASFHQVRSAALQRSIRRGFAVTFRFVADCVKLAMNVASIANFIKSAALPWMTVLIAVRSGRCVAVPLVHPAW